MKMFKNIKSGFWNFFKETSLYLKNKNDHVVEGKNEKRDGI